MKPPKKKKPASRPSAGKAGPAFASLRRRAAQALRLSPRKPAAASGNGIHRIMQELEVHQVELELQNEELLRAQTEAEEARAKYADLYEFAPVGYFTLKGDGIVQEVNLGGAVLLGHSRRRILNQPFPMFLQQGSRQAFRTIYRQALQTSKQLTAEVTTTSGKRALMVMVECASDAPNPACVRLALSDTTEWRKTEDALREAEERFHLVVQGIEDYAIYTLDLTGHVTSWNEGAERMMHYRPEEILGKHFSQFYPPEDRTRGRAAVLLKTAASTGRGTDQGWQLRKGGALFWADTLVTALRNENGAVRGFVKVKRDITQRMLAEQQFKQSHEQLQDLAARLQLAREEERTRIAHEIHDELGQALTGLKLDIAWIKGQLSEASPALQDKLTDMSDLADSTIQSVRDVATELRPIVLDQLGLLPAMEWWAGTFESRTGLPCKLNFSLREVVLDRDQRTAMFRIFQEILTNIARHANASVVTVAVKESTGMLILEVSDDGRGITQAEMADPKSLGLAGMRQRASLLHGEVVFIGRPGHGTTVTLTMPLERTKAPEDMI